MSNEKGEKRRRRRAPRLSVSVSSAPDDERVLRAMLELRGHHPAEVEAALEERRGVIVAESERAA